MARAARRLLYDPYMRAIERAPWTTKLVTSGVLMGAGDVVAQVGVERRKVADMDMARLARMSAIGLCVSGPMVTGWYLILERTIKLSTVSRTAVAMTITDQTLFSPTIISVFFAMNVVLDGRPLSDAKKEVRELLWPTLKANWTIWPAAQLINFNFVPPQMRVLFVSTIALFWNSYISFAANAHDCENENESGEGSSLDDIDE